MEVKEAIKSLCRIENRWAIIISLKAIIKKLVESANLKTLPKTTRKFTYSYRMTVNVALLPRLIQEFAVVAKTTTVFT